MKHFLEEYGGIVIAAMIAIVLIGIVFAFLHGAEFKAYLNTMIIQMMQ